jgi:hypothetical protein
MQAQWASDTSGQEFPREKVSKYMYTKKNWLILLYLLLLGFFLLFIWILQAPNMVLWRGKAGQESCITNVWTQACYHGSMTSLSNNGRGKSPALPMSEHNFCNLLDENDFSCVSV